MELNTSYYRQRSRILREALDEIDAMSSFTAMTAEGMRSEISKNIQVAMVRLDELRQKFEQKPEASFEVIE